MSNTTEFKQAFDNVTNNVNSNNITADELKTFLSDPINRQKMRAGRTHTEKYQNAQKVAIEMNKLNTTKKQEIETAIRDALITLTVIRNNVVVQCSDILAGKRSEAQQSTEPNLKLAASLVSLHYMMET